MGMGGGEFIPGGGEGRMEANEYTGRSNFC